MAELNLIVEGMSCSGCEANIAFAFETLDGVESVVADHTTGRIAIIHDPDRISAGTVRNRLDDVGYRVEP